MIHLEPNTKWEINVDTPRGTKVVKIDASDLVGNPLTYKIQPSDILLANASTGVVTLVSDLHNKVCF